MQNTNVTILDISDDEKCINEALMNLVHVAKKMDSNESGKQMAMYKIILYCCI